DQSLRSFAVDHTLCQPLSLGHDRGIVVSEQVLEALELVQNDQVRLKLFKSRIRHGNSHASDDRVSGTTQLIRPMRSMRPPRLMIEQLFEERLPFSPLLIFEVRTKRGEDVGGHRFLTLRRREFLVESLDRCSSRKVSGP